MREVIERVQANGRHLLGLISDVLDLTKIEAGQLALSLADFSLNDVVDSVILALESLAIEKGLSFKAELPAHLPTGEADARRGKWLLHGGGLRFGSRHQAGRPGADIPRVPASR